MCSNQRRQIDAAETPPGFWNPLIPDTPEDQRKQPIYDDRFARRREQNNAS